jgi:hypothetical protein
MSMRQTTDRIGRRRAPGKSVRDSEGGQAEKAPACLDPIRASIQAGADKGLQRRLTMPIAGKAGITKGDHSAYAFASPEGYGTPAIAFHLISVVLVVAVGVLGLLHDSWSKDTQAFWINIHALIGLLIWVLVVARFGWRRRHAPPRRRDIHMARSCF